MSNIVNLKEIPNVVGANIIGNSVFCDGRRVPRMRCIEHANEIEIILDDRFSYTFSKELAYLAVSFAAQAMAIGEGYSNFGADSKDRPFAGKVFMIDSGDLS